MERRRPTAVPFHKVAAKFAARTNHNTMIAPYRRRAAPGSAFFRCCFARMEDGITFATADCSLLCKPLCARLARRDTSLRNGPSTLVSAIPERPSRVSEQDLSASSRWRNNKRPALWDLDKARVGIEAIMGLPDGVEPPWLTQLAKRSFRSSTQKLEPSTSFNVLAPPLFHEGIK